MAEQADDPFATKHHTPIPLEIPGFTLISELGRGAFGVVYKAVDKYLDRPVAIKLPLVDDPKKRDQYIAEARNAARLNIDGIVQVHQVGTLPDGRVFVVQMLIEGHTLRHELKRLGKLPARRVCELMCQIASAVGAAHSNDLIHRDLKPENILIDRLGNPWVADFGLAMLESEQAGHRGERAGTPLYMSPEQILGKAEWLDGRSDIYSLGIILYELLVGKTPFRAASFQELEEQILHRDPKPISQADSSIPEVFDQIFRKCCAKRVEDRYAGAAGLIHDLQLAGQRSSPNVANAGPITVGAGEVHSESGSSQAGKSTRSNSAIQTVRDVRPESRKQSGLLIGVALIVAASMCGLAAVQYLNRTKENRPTPVEVPPVALTPITPVEPEKPPAFEPGPKTWRIDRDSSGDFDSIGEALAKARDGDTLELKGSFQEDNLVISKNLTLTASKASKPRIKASHGPAIIVSPGARLKIVDLEIEGVSLNQGTQNTIDVSGTLVLDNCVINSTTFNAVNAKAGASFQAKGCTFGSTAHAAVCLEGVKNTLIEKCTFDVREQSLDGKKFPYGVDADNSSGRVKDCTFSGNCQTGIVWKRSSDKIQLLNNHFTNCYQLIGLRECQNVEIDSSAQEVVNCTVGVLLISSQATIRGLKLSGRQFNNDASLGIVIDGESKSGLVKQVRIEDCDLRDFHRGVVIGNCEDFPVELKSVAFAGNVYGLNSCDSKRVTLSACTFDGNTAYGAVLWTTEGVLTGCKFAGNRLCSLEVQDNLATRNSKSAACRNCTFTRTKIGVNVIAGKVALESCGIEEVDEAGICFGEPRERPQKQTSGQVRRNLIPEVYPPLNNLPPGLSLEKNKLNCSVLLYVMKPGEFEVQDKEEFVLDRNSVNSKNYKREKISANSWKFVKPTPGK